MKGNLSEKVKQISDPDVRNILFYLMSEEKSNNILVRDIDSKLYNITEKLWNLGTLLEKLDTMSTQIAELNEKLDQTQQQNRSELLSERDREILDFVVNTKRVCAEDVQGKFGYKGRNAASARLNNLYQKGMLKKIHAGRNVYYTP